MSTTIVVLTTVGILGTVLLVGLMFWVTRATKKQAEAEAKTKALLKAKELRHEGNKIMAEPVADESAWLAAARERVSNDGSGA